MPFFKATYHLEHATLPCISREAIIETDCDGVILGVRSWLDGTAGSTTEPAVPGGYTRKNGPCPCAPASSDSIVAATRVADSTSTGDLYLIDSFGRLVIPDRVWAFDNLTLVGDGSGTPFAWNPDSIGTVVPDTDPELDTDLVLTVDKTTDPVNPATKLVPFNIVQARLKPRGTSADRARIQARIDARGFCELAKGTFGSDGTSIVLDYQQTLVGTGAGSVLKPAATTGFPVISVTGQAWETRIADLLIEGDTATGNFGQTGGGIVIDAGNTPRSYPNHHGDNGPVIDNVRVAYLNGDGIVLKSSTSGDTLVGAQIHKCNVYQVLGHGFVLDKVTDSQIIGNVSGDTGKNGFKLSSGNCRYIGNKAYFSGDSGTAAQRADGRGYGWNLDYCHRDQFEACESQDSMHHGWYFNQVGNTRLVNCLSDASGWGPGSGSHQASISFAAGFYLSAAIDGTIDLIVQGGNFRTPRMQDYHVYVASGVTASYIHGRLLNAPLSSMSGAAAVGGPGASSVAWVSSTGAGILVLG